MAAMTAQDMQRAFNRLWGESLRVLKKQHNFFNYQMAEMLGISETELDDIFNGNTPMTAELYLKLIETFGKTAKITWE